MFAPYIQTGYECALESLSLHLALVFQSRRAVFSQNSKAQECTSLWLFDFHPLDFLEVWECQQSLLNTLALSMLANEYAAWLEPLVITFALQLAQGYLPATHCQAHFYAPQQLTRRRQKIHWSLVAILRLISEVSETQTFQTFDPTDFQSPEDC